MDWERITPQSGMRGGDRPNLTISLRTPAKGGRPKVTLTIGVDLSRRLEWKAKQRVHIDIARSAGLLRLATTTDARDSYSLHQAGGGNVLESTFSLLGLDSETRKAEPVEHRVEAGALLVTLPEWARLPVHDVQEPPEPEVAAMPDSAPAIPDKAPPIPDKPPAMPDKPAAMHGSAPTMHTKPPAMADSATAMHAKPPTMHAKPPTAHAKAARSTYRTEERDAVMLRAWPDPKLTRRQIMLELQALPGPAIPASEPTLYDWAAHLGLPSQRSSQPGFIAAASVAVQQPAPAPDPAPDLADAAVAKKTAKAREMLGRGSDPSVVATHCTLPLREVFRLQAEMREAKRAGAAA